MANLKIDRKKSPKFTIEFEDGTIYSVDPIDIVFELQSVGLDKITTFDKKQRQQLKDIFGLPSLSTTDMMGVFADFQEYVANLHNEVAWMKKLQENAVPEVVDIETTKLLEKFPIENCNIK